MKLIPKFLRDLASGGSPDNNDQVDQTGTPAGAPGGGKQGDRGRQPDERDRQPMLHVGAGQPVEEGGPVRSDNRNQGWSTSSAFAYRCEPDSPFHQHGFNTRGEFLRSPKAPRILISDHAYRRMCLIVELAPKEVGWLGTVERMPSGNFYIDEVFVPEQEVTGAETDPTDEGQFKVMNELAQMGEEGMQKIEKLRFWGHSHVRMMTSPSGTDENTPLNYHRLGLPWFIRGIFNKLGRAEFTVYLFEDGHRFIDVPWVAVDAQTGENLSIERTRYTQGPFRSGESDGRQGVPERQGDLRDTQPAYVMDNGAGLSGSGSSSSQSPITLHPKLIPSETERKQVEDELKAKLRERYFGGFFGGWGKGDDERNPRVEESDGIQRRASLHRETRDQQPGDRRGTAGGDTRRAAPDHRDTRPLAGSEE